MPTIGVQMMMLKSKVEESGALEVLRRLTDIGFHAVEVSQIPMSADNVEQMRRAREELGMDFSSLSAVIDASKGNPNESLTTDFDKIVRDARTLDVNMIRIGMMPYPAMMFHDQLLSFCREANQAAKRLADEGIQLYYHNHHIEFAKVDGKTLLDIIVEQAPEMRLEIDVHWVQRGGKDPVRTLQKYSGVVDLIHLKDYRIGAIPLEAYERMQAGDFSRFSREFSDVVQFAEIGEGNLEWNEIIDTALDSGAQYLLIEQDKQYGRDPYDCLVRSRENLVELGYGALL